jgi:post-segregation antitoxin (ccd killing protein)
MKRLSLVAGAVWLALAPMVSADAGFTRTSGPCFDVNVQIDQTNQARVAQDCTVNISRTVQAGQRNEVYTRQAGTLNDNRVRQLHYVPPGPRSGLRRD